MRSPAKWPREPDNWYTEERWCSRRLFAVEPFDGRVVDPCAGLGHIVASALEAGLRAEGYDLRERSGGPAGRIRGNYDWFEDPMPYTHGTFPCDNIVSNPPYGDGPIVGTRLEDGFLTLALDRARCKVAIFLPASWPNGDKRGRWLETLPWYRTYLLSPRPSCPPGYVVAAGDPTGQGTKDFCWFVFLKGYRGAPTIHYLRRDP